MVTDIKKLFEAPRLSDQEIDVIGRIDELRRTLRLQVADTGRWTGVLRRGALARAVQASNSIEGYNVSLDDAIAATQDGEPLDAGEENWAATVGYQRAMTYILQIANDRHLRMGEDLVRSLHFMIMDYDLTKWPGRYRDGTIYVRDELKGEIVYEGPTAEAVPELMATFTGALDPGSPPTDHPVLVAGAMAHLNLAMIHPFKDGNGRMARAVQTLVLAREGILTPEFCSIEEYLGRHTRDYYDVLADVGRGSWQPDRDAQPWIRFCLTAHLRQAGTLLRRVAEAAKRWEAIQDEIGRHDLPERAAVALMLALVGYRVRNASYRFEADVGEAVARRDLRALVDAGLLEPKGEKRGRHYVRSKRLQQIRERTQIARAPEEDPFA